MVWADLSVAGANLLVKTLDGIESNSILPIKQDLTKSSPAPKLKSEMYCIDWHKSSVEIHNQIRAFSPKPGAFTILNNTRIKLFESQLADTNSLKHGEFKFIDERIIVGTGKGDLIIESVQLEGKRRMPVLDFYKGMINKIEGKVISFG